MRKTKKWNALYNPEKGDVRYAFKKAGSVVKRLPKEERFRQAVLKVKADHDAEILKAQDRSEHARKAALARWAKEKKQ